MTAPGSLGEALQADRAAAFAGLQDMLAMFEATATTRIVEPGEPGMRLRVATVADRHVDVLLMLVTWRVVEWPVDDPTGYGRYWCYTDATSLLSGLLIWSRDGYRNAGAGGEPIGWVKAHCECRHGTHRPSCRHDPARGGAR